MNRQVPGTGDSLELSAVREPQVEVLEWRGCSGQGMVRCTFPAVSRGNKEPDITEYGADSQSLEKSLIFGIHTGQEE